MDLILVASDELVDDLDNAVKVVEKRLFGRILIKNIVIYYMLPSPLCLISQM